jgi:transcriptional regulator with GAF, ATPase, and Fis domain
VREGQFREDLYYRLNVFPIYVPPLRERREDIGILATAFAQKFAPRLGRTLEPLTEDSLRRLQAYSWPGNVRELQNIIERAVITARDGRLNLDRALPESVNANPAGLGSDGETSKRVRTAKELEELERNNVIVALETAQWKIGGENGAARLLGLKPTTLSSRMKALGIKRNR